MAEHNDTGTMGEALARRHLEEEGFAVVETNWRRGKYEVDIIAYREGLIVFAEVKTRSDNYVDPLLSITGKKIANLVKAARAYMAQAEIVMPVQFDVITIVGTPSDYVIEHFPDAFYPPLRSFR